jgi:hypothetical protein
LQQSVFSTAIYTLTKKEALRTSDRWSYIGFSLTYDKSLAIKSQYKDVP